MLPIVLKTPLLERGVGLDTKSTDETKNRGASDRVELWIWKISAVATLGVLLAQIDATIVNVSLSALATDLNAGLSTIQWVTSGYLLALTLVLPLSGWLVDRIGAKAVYIWCFFSFTVSSALCGLAWSAQSLIAFRVLQGLSGGLLAPMAQTILARSAGRHLARVMGISAAPILIAPIFGPIIAGAILQYWSWRWLFLVNLPVGALAIALAFLFLPNDREEARHRKLDWIGLALLPPGLVFFLYGSERIGESLGRGALAASIVLLAAFLWSAKRQGDRALIELRLFKNKVFSSCVVTQFVSNGQLFAGQMLIPIFLIQGCGRTPGEMGWMLLPIGFGMMITYPTVGAVTNRLGARRIAGGGALLSLVSTLPFIYLATHGLNLFVLAPALFFRGMGQSAVGVPSISSAYASVNRRDLSMATTTLNVVQRLGGPTFTTICATVLAWRLGVQPAVQETGFTPYAWAFVFLCGLHAVTFLSALRLPMRMEAPAS